MALRNIRLKLAYDGTPFAGWQVQPDQPTIQSELERAVLETSGEVVRFLSAGRTDSGVHALGQVANFRTESPIPPDRWRPALQTKLPPEIVVLESDEVPLEFHSTFSARSKRYRYVIHNRIVSSPFLRNYAWRISQPLSAEAMHAAAQCLVGTHDFRSFESHWPNKASSVRTVTHLSIQRASGWDLWQDSPLHGPFPGVQNSAEPAPFICLEIEADGFLYNMVRAITGTLVNVGRGTWSAADIQRVLEAQDRDIAGGTAPACGLYMVCVNYNGDPAGPGNAQLDE